LKAYSNARKGRIIDQQQQELQWRT
jgi:hypothetical protein